MKCPTCEGTGKVDMFTGKRTVKVNCDTCRGTGSVPDE